MGTFLSENPLKIPTNRIAVLDEGDLGKFEILKYLVDDKILFIFDGEKFVYILVVWFRSTLHH